MTAFALGMLRYHEGWQDHFLRETFDAIEASSLKPEMVVFVDNGEEKLDRWPAWWLPTQVIRPRSPLGVAGGFNLIHKVAKPLPIILIGADLAIAPDTFEKMMEPEGPLMLCAWGMTCCRIDEEVWRAVGDLDENFYPAYYEDVDFMHRARLVETRILEWETFPRTTIYPGRESGPSGITHGKHDPEGYQGLRGEGLKKFHDSVEANKQYFIRKWGDLPDAPVLYKRPFG